MKWSRAGLGSTLTSADTSYSPLSGVGNMALLMHRNPVTLLVPIGFWRTLEKSDLSYYNEKDWGLIPWSQIVL